MIRFLCPQCSKTLKAPESRVGAQSKCPKCGQPVIVPTSDSPNRPEAIQEVLALEYEKPRETIRNMQPCSDCGHVISSRAISCPRCGCPNKGIVTQNALACPDYYQLLQVTPAADPDVIEAAYKRLTYKYHPDRNYEPSAKETMKLLNDAHDVLCDPQKRIEYDAQMKHRKMQRAEISTSTLSNGPNSQNRPNRPSKSSSSSPKLAQALGLHPFVAFFTVILDCMLFGPESTIILWFFCALPLSIGIVPIVAIMQTRLYGDDWLVAIAKSMMVGILTAIPSPLPGFITGAAGIVGWLGLQEGCGKKEDPKYITE